MPCLHLVLCLQILLLRHRTISLWACRKLWEILMPSLLWTSSIIPIQPIMWMHICRPNNLLIQHLKVIHSPRHMTHMQLCIGATVVIRYPRRSEAEVRAKGYRPQISPISQSSKGAHGISQGIHGVHTIHAHSLAHQKLSRYIWWTGIWFILRAGFRKRRDQIGTLTQVWKGAYTYMFSWAYLTNSNFFQEDGTHSRDISCPQYTWSSWRLVSWTQEALANNSTYRREEKEDGSSCCSRAASPREKFLRRNEKT